MKNRKYSLILIVMAMLLCSVTIVSSFPNLKVSRFLFQKGLNELHDCFVKNIRKQNFVVKLENEELSSFFCEKNSDIVAILIDNLGCQRCYNTLLNQIDSICKDKSKILIITNFKNKRQEMYFKDKYFSYPNHINIPGITLSFDEDEKFNCIFVLGKDLIGSNFFIPSIKFPNLTKEYVNKTFEDMK